VATRPDSELIRKSREAMRQKMNDIIAREPAPPPGFSTPQAVPGSSEHEAVSAAQQAARRSPASAKPAKRQAPTFQPAQPFQTLQGPPLPISADKQSKLADLLRKYQADLVTPSQYHEARAKILAEP